MIVYLFPGWIDLKWMELVLSIAFPSRVTINLLKRTFFKIRIEINRQFGSIFNAFVIKNLSHFVNISLLCFQICLGISYKVYVSITYITIGYSISIYRGNRPDPGRRRLSKYRIALCLRGSRHKKNKNQEIKIAKRTLPFLLLYQKCAYTNIIKGKRYNYFPEYSSQ